MLLSFQHLHTYILTFFFSVLFFTCIKLIIITTRYIIFVVCYLREPKIFFYLLSTPASFNSVCILLYSPFTLFSRFGLLISSSICATCCTTVCKLDASSCEKFDVSAGFKPFTVFQNYVLLLFVFVYVSIFLIIIILFLFLS